MRDPIPGFARLLAKIAAMGLVLALASCGDSSQVVQGPSPSSVAVQPGDLPGGLLRCDISGDMASFLNKEKSADAATYASVKSDWDSARSNGATAAYTALYANSAEHCALFQTSGANPGAATYKLVVNFVVQFKSVASAAAAYTSGSVFSFSVADLKGAGVPITEGLATGLTDHSIIRTAVLPDQTVFVALWQNQKFLVILAILNVGPGDSRHAALAENSRIK
jgi:hypothetical protein